MTALHRLTAAQNQFKACRPGARALSWLLRIACAAALTCSLFAVATPALAVNDDAVLRRMDAALEENTRLHDEAWKARKQGREAAKQAEDAVNASDDRLERTRVEALAHVAGVTPNQVESLRRDGKSWGQAAGELGVHPGFLGVGKAPLYQSLPNAKTKVTKAKAGKKGTAKPQAKGKGSVEKKPAAMKKAEKKAPPTSKKKTTDKKNIKKSKK